MNRQFEEKLKLRDAEIFRMREATHLLQKNSVLNSRRQSTRTSISRDTGYEADELRNIVEDKEHELSVSKEVKGVLFLTQPLLFSI